MAGERRDFLPGPGCIDDDSCYFFGQCKEARRIKQEISIRRAQGVSSLRYEILTSKCQSPEVDEAKKEARGF